MSTPRISTAVIPAAGLGTRFLPATKSQPKEMLPIVDKPAIQYAVEEAVQADLCDVVVVTGRHKQAIEDYFAPDPGLERVLERSQRLDLLAEVHALSTIARLRYVTQLAPLGLGHAVLQARSEVGGEGFAVLLPDDLIVDHAGLLRTMLGVRQAKGGSVIALMEVAPEEISAYGCAGVEEAVGGDGPEPAPVRVHALVEKPTPAVAPSNLAVVGRYVFGPEIFDALDRIVPGAGGELQLTDAIALLVEETPVHGVVFRGRRYDVGSKLDFLRANVELALERDDLGPGLDRVLAGLHRRAASPSVGQT